MKKLKKNFKCLLRLDLAVHSGSFTAMLIFLRAGIPQCDEEQQQICAKLRNIYQIPIFLPALQDFFRAVMYSYIDDMNMYNDVKRRGYM